MIVERAYLELYPDAKLGKFDFSLNYSGKFSDYNANIKRRGKTIEVSLSRAWERINDDVKIGLIQHLMNKLFKTKIETQSMELYEIFLKKVHLAIPKDKTDPVLRASFDRVDQEYFFGSIECPNLEWGTDSMRTLGRYEYGTDTVTVSTLFKEAEPDLLDYIMYHELLHKKHKFRTTKGRSFHHTKEFLEEEKRFRNFDQMESRIGQLIRSYKRQKRFLRFF